jgi:hypothetical protein
VRLGAIVRTNDRAILLGIVLKELLRYRTFPGVDSMAIHVLADRPTPEVSKVLDEYYSDLFAIRTCTFPLVSREGGQRISEGENLQLEDLDNLSLDWIFHADDDHWFEPLHAQEELPTALTRQDVDIFYAHQLFFWDAPDRVCPPLSRPHYSPQIFRHIPGDRFPLNRIIQAPAQIHDQAILSGRVGHLTTPLLDYSCFSQEDRFRLYNLFVGAGKTDEFISSLVAPGAGSLSFPSDLVKLGYMPDLRFKDLFKEATCAST